MSCERVITHVGDHSAQRIVIAQCASAELPPAPRPVINSKNVNNFYAALLSVDWPEVVEKCKGKCSQLSESLTNTLINKFDICFPNKVPNTSNKRNPWVDTETINLKLLLFDTLNLKNKYPLEPRLADAADKIYAKYNAMIKRKRTNYYSELIKRDTNKSKRMWSVINIELGRKNNNRVDFTELIRDNHGQAFQSKHHAVDLLNKEFVTAAALCGAPAPDPLRCLRALSASVPPCDRSLKLRPFTPDEVVKILRVHIASKNSCDIYNLSASTLKQVGGPLCYVLSELYNLCIREGAIPQEIKKVKISPLYLVYYIL